MTDTSATCADIGCVERLVTEHGTFIRFRNDGEAARWATVLGDDARRWTSIVLDMSEVDLDVPARAVAVDILSSRHDWS